MTSRCSVQGCLGEAPKRGIHFSGAPKIRLGRIFEWFSGLPFSLQMGLEPIEKNIQKSWFWRPLSRKRRIWASQGSSRFWCSLWLRLKVVSSFLLRFTIFFISLRNRVSAIGVVKIDFRVFLESKIFCFCRTSRPKWPLYFFITHQKKCRSFRKVWIS